MQSRSLSRPLSSRSDLRPARNARSGKLAAVLWRTRTRVGRTLAWLHRLAYAIWSELRSLPPRIAFLRSNRLDQVLTFGKAFEVRPGQRPLPNRCTHARILDTRSLQETLRWVTVVDRYLFLEGWSRGFEFGRSYDTSDLGTGQTQTPTLLPSSCALTDDAGSCHSNLSSDQPSIDTPAAIAGVTRKLE